eukprot:GILK01006900.1.p1 GENE.GILK01006900.1~~GILK01006900.1.p1  ORF type:complete len:1010 (-),score=273.20 GILK01006900.1:58-3087(-)
MAFWEKDREISTQDSEAVKRISDFLKGLQATGVGTKAKKSIKDFSEYFFANKPHLSDFQIRRILQGDLEKQWKGLLQACGNRNRTQSELKRASGLALELLAKFLNRDLNPQWEDFRESFMEVDEAVLRAMRLDKHILSSRSDPLTVCKLVQDILAVRTYVNLVEFMPGEEGRKKYQEWLEAQKAMEPEGDPKCWADVKFDDDEIIETLSAAPQALLQPEQLSSLETLQDPLGIRDRTNEEGAEETRRLVKNAAKKKKKASEIPKDTDPNQNSIASSISANEDLGPYHTASEAFNPMLFLGKVHKESKYEELRKGLDHLKEELGSRTSQMKKLVKQHLDQFVHCKETIDSIHDAMQSDVKSDSGKTAILEDTFTDLYETANEIFGPLQDRKKEVDRIRGVLAVLQRFSFLFSLPSNIKQFCSQKQYDKVVQSYKKAKSLKSAAQLSLFEAVLNEVDSLVKQAREQLLDSLAENETDDDLQDKYIRFLIELDVESDPGWFVLNQLHLRLEEMLDKAEKKLKAQATGRKSKLIDDDDRDSDIDDLHDDISDFFSDGGDSDVEDPHHERTDEEDDLNRRGSSLTNFVQDYMDALERMWKFASEYGAGKYATANQKAAKTGVSELATKSTAVMEEVVTDFKEKMTDWLATSKSTASQEAVADFHPVMLKIGNSYNSLSSAKFPKSCLAILSALQNTIFDFLLTETFRRLHTDVQALYVEENWSIDPEAQQGTSLPRTFRQLVGQTLRNLKTLVSAVPNFAVDSMRQPFFKTMSNFADSLEEASTSELFASSSLTEDQRCLLVMTNVRRTRETILPDLLTVFCNLFCPRDHKMMENEAQPVITKMKNIETTLLQRFVKAKTDIFESVIELGLSMSLKDAGIVTELSDLRSYTLELLTELVFVHDEVVRSAVHALTDIITMLVENMLGLFKPLLGKTKPEPAEVLQLWAEIEFITLIVSGYRSNASDSTTKQLYSLLQANQREDQLFNSTQSLSKKKLLRDMKFRTQVNFESLLSS